MKNENKILIVDIETTGFLKAGGLIVEIGAAELDVITGEVREVYNSLCREQGFSEQHRNAWIFSNSDLCFEDVWNARDSFTVCQEFQELLKQYPDGATAYNSSFDFNFLKSRGVEPVKLLPCPMRLSTPVCKLPSRNGKRGCKWPSVEEAWFHFFPTRPYVEAHRGADDAVHEAEIVYELIKRGVFKVDGDSIGTGMANDKPPKRLDFLYDFHKFNNNQFYTMRGASRIKQYKVGDRVDCFVNGELRRQTVIRAIGLREIVKIPLDILQADVAYDGFAIVSHGEFMNFVNSMRKYKRLKSVSEQMTVLSLESITTGGADNES